ncbi:MAG: hypothetical protein AAF228_14195, partial [Pseudomonadota bacterium]
MATLLINLCFNFLQKNKEKIDHNFILPVPRFENFDALNMYLEQQCLHRQGALLRGHKETIEQRLSRDLDALMDLPPTAYEPCE